MKGNKALLTKYNALIQSVGVFLNDQETGQPVEVKFCTDASECDLDKVMTFGLDVITKDDYATAESTKSQGSNIQTTPHPTWVIQKIWMIQKMVSAGLYTDST